jgi:hypothetical protein
MTEKWDGQKHGHPTFSLPLYEQSIDMVSKAAKALYSRLGLPGRNLILLFNSAVY